jgi:hypothetical protein
MVFIHAPGTLMMKYKCISPDTLTRNAPRVHMSVYPKVSGLAAWSENCKCTVLCHYVQLYRYFVSQPSEFCHHNLCCFSTSVYCCKCTFRYRLSPENFGTLSYISTDTYYERSVSVFLAINAVYMYSSRQSHWE